MTIAIRPSTMIPQPAPRPVEPAPVAFRAPDVRTINEEAGGLLVNALKEMIKHPGLTAKSFGAMLVEPFVHPGRGVARIAEAWHKDGWFSGLLAASLYLSTAITTASFALMALAVLAAPFTGGASLALVPMASTVMVWTGVHDAVVCTAILGKDEWDAAHAKSRDDLDRKEGMLADDFINTFFAWVTLPMTDADTALTVAPQGLWMSARGAVKRSGRAAIRVSGRGND